MNLSDEETVNEKQHATSKSSKTVSAKNSNVNNDNTQKRPMNAFLIFCKRHRSVVKDKYPHLENRSITKLLGEWWAKITPDEKKTYTELAKQYKEAFLKAHPSFKWYKTDIKLLPNMQQPCSPPSYVSFTNNSTLNNTNASLNRNLFNNGNTTYQTSESSSSSTQKQSNGSNTTNQSDLNNHISAIKNDKLINDKQTDKAALSANSSTTTSNTSNNLTPKPPKKRYLDYLENGEFKEPVTQITTTSSNSTASASSSTITDSKNDCKTNLKKANESQDSSKNYAIGGPPVLDIDTMNRVIENAFGASLSEESANKKSSKVNSSKKSSDSQQGLLSLSNKKNQLNKDNSASSSKMNSLDNELKSDRLNDLRCNEKFNDSSEQFDKTSTSKDSRSNSPLNSSVIDKFISVNSKNSPSASNLDKDKFNLKLDKESNDKPLNLSSTTTVKASQQALIDNLIDKLLSNGSEGSPMSIEMLQNNINSSKQNSQKKERSCKGKRYLEMLNENKLAKRSKNASTSSICSNGEDSNNKSSSSTNQGGSSKWVSCGFDLEERIAALPQLTGDNHLINALDSTNSSLNKNEHQANNNNNILLNNNEHNKKNSTGTTTVTSTTINNKQTDSASFAGNMNSSKQPNENLNENEQLSKSSAELAEKIVERLSINQLHECNGLVALAEAAYSMAE